eukprot:TRINITY_DN2551_c0_g3_i3.p1 TRINITY_DN2551_c0_g3~~TRINITY_DN2551_c0_g3_i3.p1  ORF type:complete len:205 (-),score=52.37 TRINITY_DN2551_c0_g3_i3:668-1282(-)
MSAQKVVILGEGGVGKSALTIQFVNNHFITDYDPTIENSYRKQITVDDKTLMLDILDTAGQEEFCTMRDQYIRSGKGFLIVYSITSRQTFEKISELREQILLVKDEEDFPIVLIGNKADLETERVVTKDEGAALAKGFKIPFLETSAKNKININESFEAVVREIRKWNGEAPAAPATGGPAANTNSDPKDAPTGKPKKKGCWIL